jgi:hypothetical protein
MKTNGFSTFSVSAQLVFKRFSKRFKRLQSASKKLQEAPRADSLARGL